MKWGDLLPLLGMLFTVILILFGAYFFTKNLPRMRIGGFLGASRGAKMRILDQLSMGRDWRIVLVQVGSRHLLLGVAAGEISLLAELSSEEAALWTDEDPQDKNGDAGSPPSFKDSFMEALSQKRSKGG